MKRRDTQRTGGDESGLLGDCRGANEIIGYAVLIGILSVTIAIIGFGGGAESLLALQQQPVESSGQQAMSQLAAEMDAIALGAAGTRQVDIVPRTDSTRTVDPDAGNFTILVEEDGVVEHQSGPHDLGAVIFEHGGTEIAYQGGGVWQKSGERSLMIVEPPVSYNSQLGRESASLDVSLVSIAGEHRQTGETVQLTDRGATASEAFDFPVYENTTVTLQVNSEYVHGWADYLDDEFPGNVTDDDISGNTVNATFEPIVPGDAAVGENENFVDIDSPGQVEVTLLAAETTEPGNDPDNPTTTWMPTTANVSVTDEDGNQEIVEDWAGVHDYNASGDPGRNLGAVGHKVLSGEEDEPPYTQPGKISTEFDVSKGDNITILTQFYDTTGWGSGCDGYRIVDEDGTRWSHQSCTDLGQIDLEVDATTGSNVGNVRVLRDGQLVPDLEVFQRSQEEGYGEGLRQSSIQRIFTQNSDVNLRDVTESDNDRFEDVEIRNADTDASNNVVNQTQVSELDLEDNQVIFMFELWDDNAEWNDEGDIPEMAESVATTNFNNAVFLLEINTDASNVQTRVTVNSVSVE